MTIVIVDSTTEDFSQGCKKNDVVQAINIQVDGMILGAMNDGLEGCITLFEQQGLALFAKEQ